MMVGEQDFNAMYHTQNYLGTKFSVENKWKDYFLTSVFYEGTTYVVYLLFLITMSILIMNLLVSLLRIDI